MKVLDEALWQKQAKDLVVDETSQAFKDFLVAWVDEAETQIAAEYEGTVLDCLRQALTVVEAQKGRVHINYLGQMLVLIAGHWEHGAELVATLSPIELRLVEDHLQCKINELQKEAEIMIKDTCEDDD